MNKQQLIDKAIDDLDGKYPFPAHVYLHKAGCNYFSCDSKLTSFAGAAYICSFQEFQKRQAEREAMARDVDMVRKAMGLLGLEKTPITKQHQLDAIAAKIDEIKSENQHWYDYENQKALRLPPVGEVCLVYSNGSFQEAKVLEIANNTLDDIIVCRIFDRQAKGVGTLGYFSAARPLDWNKRSARNELAQLIESHGNLSSGQLADSILAAGYRKCDN